MRDTEVYAPIAVPEQKAGTERKWCANKTFITELYLPMYLRDFGDEPSFGNLHFPTYLQDKSINYSTSKAWLSIFSLPRHHIWRIPRLSVMQGNADSKSRGSESQVPRQFGHPRFEWFVMFHVRRRCEVYVAAYADTCLLPTEVKSAPECDMWGFGTGGGLCVALSFESSHHQIIEIWVILPNHNPENGMDVSPH
ncbi:unnamed protein product [Prunus armeniaca]|uniref:Uncharacterized protein n=1 Tax=Prunus armeniaca TaxID=36596 RepID=A0A6J5TU32_PRUAR|nr:unnamed protein product [Prunus armeniaca]